MMVIFNIFISVFGIVFVGFLIGVFATHEYYKGRVRRMKDAHTRQLNEAMVAEYRKGHNAGLFFTRTHVKRNTFTTTES